MTAQYEKIQTTDKEKLITRQRGLHNRINEEKKMTKELLVETCNKAIQVTFNRTLFTSITTLLPIIALIVLGTNDILTFNMAMLMGLIAGTYSSIMIAGTVFIALEKRSIGKPKKKKIIYTDEFEERKIKGVNC